jgi:autotransporter-associated beta strand protein
MSGLSVANVRNSGALIDDGGFAITIAQPLLHSTVGGDSATDGGLIKQGGAGTLTLSGNNTYNGGTTIKAGTISVSSDNNLGNTSGVLTNNGGTLLGTAIFTNSRTVMLTGAATFNANSSTILSLGAGFSAPTTTAGITIGGGGTLSVKGNVSVVGADQITVNNATLEVDPGAGGTFSTAGKFVVGNASGNAVMNFKSGTGTFTAASFFVVGDSATTVNGTLNLLGGAMNLNLGVNQRVLIGNAGNGNVNVSGGTLSVGSNPTIQLGGDINFSGNNASGTLTVSGTGAVVVNSSASPFIIGNNSGVNTGAKGTLNLYGGTLTTSRNILGSNGTSIVNFSGGTLIAGAASTSLITNLTSAVVSTNGAIIDDGGFVIAIGQPLVHDATLAGADGGLTKLNTGDLTLAGANTYTGPTLVKAGRLFVNGSLGTNSATVTNGATLLGTGTINGAVALLSGGTLQPGNGGLTIGTLTLNNTLSLAGKTLMALNRTNAQTSSRLQGLASLPYGGTLTVTNLGPALQSGDTFTLFSASAYSGTFTSLTLPTLSAGLAWDTTMLAQNGTLSVATVPSVVVAPSTTNAECGSSVTFVASPSGTAPFGYQWFDTLTNAISGATNASLLLTNVHFPQAGNYTVLVTNNVGTASAVGALTVSDTLPPVVTVAGANPLSVPCHGTFTDPGASALDACAGVLPVATNGTVNADVAGAYTITYTADDGNGHVASATRTVNVGADTNAPAISSQPQSRTNLVGTDAQFQVLASSCSPITYQWYFATTNLLTDQTNASLTVSNVQLVSAGEYSAVLANSAGSVTSAVAVLTVDQPPVAADISASTIQNHPLMVSKAKVLAGCSDPDGDPLAIVSAGPASTNGGAVTLTSSNITYVPLTDFVGTDRFTYTISDGRGGTNSAFVLITATSAGAPSLNIVSQPTLLPNGHFHVGFAGIPGYAYTVDYSDSSAAGPWTTITNLTAGSNGLFDFEDPTEPAPPTRFYRTTYP